MMTQNSFTLESLLESHESPFIVISNSLHIIAVNKAWETCFGIARHDVIGRPCCNANQHCRHRELLLKFEPYSGLYPSIGMDSPLDIRVRGYPLLDAEGHFYIGEVVTNIANPMYRPETPEIIGHSPAFMQFRTKLDQAAKSLVSVMIHGETGTGKELAAKYIHAHSPVANANFVVVDCTVITESLFESELFGHEKGAFTGASSTKKGLFEIANNGTLFLDEIGDLPLHLQPKLLRVLESNEYRRVGGMQTMNSKIRVICATHKNLAAMVKAGEFREDLYYRLSVFPLEIPNLRERYQDLPELTHYLLEQFGKKSGTHYKITADAMTKLLAHRWPGNIRELRNCLHLATSLAQDNIINKQAIQIHGFNATSEQFSVPAPQISYAQPANPNNPLDMIEADFIKNLINKFNGNRRQIAMEMNISERTLYRKLSRLNLA